MPPTARFPDMKTLLCLIRHGETDWNACRRFQGQTDVPLNENGRLQARRMSENAVRYRFDAIYSSDLVRAVDTAGMLASGRSLEVARLQALRERHFGLLQGLAADEGALRYPGEYAAYKARETSCDFATGESLTQFAGRVDAVMGELAGMHRGQTIAVVTHAGVLDTVYRRATGRPLGAPRDFPIPNCALNWFSTDGRNWHLEAWDDHRYLSDVMLDSAE